MVPSRFRRALRSVISLLFAAMIHALSVAHMNSCSRDSGATLWSRRFTMVKTLTKHGNSYALIIDKPILDLLKINPDTPLEVSTDGKSLMVSPVNDPQRRMKFEAALESINKRYAKAFKRLAN
jgi:antitoxin component of MazEF toxin-antitoxin module